MCVPCQLLLAGPHFLQSSRYVFFLLLHYCQLTDGAFFWGTCDRKRVVSQGAGSLPNYLWIVTDKGRNSKEQGNLVVKEAVAAMMSAWAAPFR